MELQCSRTMLIIFVVTITAVLTEFNSNTDITLTARVTKTTIFQNHLEKEKISTTDTSIKDTKNEQENLSYSAVTLMHSAYSTNSYLAKNNSTAFFHHRDNSEHIGTIVGLTVVVVVTVVGSVFLCYYKRLLCLFSKEMKNII